MLAITSSLRGSHALDYSHGYRAGRSFPLQFNQRGAVTQFVDLLHHLFCIEGVRWRGASRAGIVFNLHAVCASWLWRPTDFDLLSVMANTAICAHHNAHQIRDATIAPTKNAMHSTKVSTPRKSLPDITAPPVQPAWRGCH